MFHFSLSAVFLLPAKESILMSCLFIFILKKSHIFLPKSCVGFSPVPLKIILCIGVFQGFVSKF